MKLNTGKVAFTINFDNGDVQQIYFNPNDPDLSVRMKDFQGKAETRIKELDDIKLNAKGEPDGIEAIETYEKFRAIICEELDRAFNAPISAVVFKHCSPFAIVNGNYFVLQFLEAITPEIQREIEKSHQGLNENIEKHLAKYKK